MISKQAEPEMRQPDEEIAATAPERPQLSPSQPPEPDTAPQPAIAERSPGAAHPGRTRARGPPVPRRERKIEPRPKNRSGARQQRRSGGGERRVKREARGERVPRVQRNARPRAPPAIRREAASARLEAQAGLTLPPELGPEVRVTVGAFLNRVQAQISLVEQTSESQQQSLSSHSQLLLSEFAASLSTVQDRVNSHAESDTRHLQVRHAETIGEITRTEETNRNHAAERQNQASTRTQEEYAAATQRIDSAGESNASGAREDGARVMIRVDERTAAAASRARTAGDRYAGQYPADYAEEAGPANRTAGEDVSAGINDQSSQLKANLFTGSEELAELLASSSARMSSDLAATQPMLQQTLAMIGGGLHDQLAQTCAASEESATSTLLTGQDSISQLLTAVIGRLTSLGESLFDSLGLATSNGNEAIDQAAAERISLMRESAQEILGRTSGIAFDHESRLADALDTYGHFFDEGAAECALELEQGRGQIGTVLDEGVEASFSGTNYLDLSSQEAFRQVVANNAPTFTNASRQAGESSAALVEEADRSMSATLERTDREIDRGAKESELRLGDARAEGSAELEKTADTGLIAIDDQIADFYAELGNALEGMRNSSNGFIAVIGEVLSAIKNSLEFLAGLVLGIIWAVIRFILGLVLLLVAAVIVAVLAIVALVALFFVLSVFVGPVAAFEIVVGLGIYFFAYVLPAIVVLAVIAGLIMMVVDIVINLWDVFTDPHLSPFDRGFLLGEVIGDILLLFIPFLKGKVKIKVPAFLGPILDQLTQTTRLLFALMRVCGGDAFLLARLLRLVAFDLTRLESLLLLVRDASRLEYLLIRVRSITVLEQLIVACAENSALLEGLLRLENMTVPILVDLIRISGSGQRLRYLLVLCDDEVVTLRWLLAVFDDDAVAMVNMIERCDDSAALLVRLLGRVDNDVAVLTRLLALTDDATQLFRFLEGVNNVAELERLLSIMRIDRIPIPLADVEFVARTSGTTLFEALRYMEALLTEARAGRIQPKNRNEVLAIIQLWRQGRVTNPRRGVAGDPDIDFRTDQGWFDIKTPVGSRLRPVVAQATDIAGHIRSLNPLGSGTNVVVDGRHLTAAEKPVFVAELEAQLTALGEDMNGMIQQGVLILINL